MAEHIFSVVAEFTVLSTATDACLNFMKMFRIDKLKNMFYFSLRYHIVTNNSKQFSGLHDDLSGEECYPH